MKLQIFLLSALLVGALAHPVPDEEVSPVKSEVKSEVKPEVVEKPVEKPVEAVQPESRATEELKKPEEPIKEKILLPATAPDAEIAQTLPEKKDEKLATEKQTRAEDKVPAADVKSLPVVEGPVAGVEAEKPVVAEEAKPAVQEVAQPVGKSAEIAAAAPAEEQKLPEAPAAEQKKDELSAIETAPAVKSDLPAPIEEPVEKPIALPVAAEEKKDEQPARQERGNEQEAAAAAATQEPKPADAQPEAEIKTVKEEKREAPVIPAIEEPAKIGENELKVLPAEKPLEITPAAPAGDIPAPAPIAAEESKLKDLKPAEPQAEKSEQPAAAPAAKQIASELATPAEPEKPIIKPSEPAAEPLKKLEEKPAAEPLAEKPLTEEKKSEESKESKESKESESESKESGESKEVKSK